MNPPCLGRLAPSPTGALHLGNARSFLLAWLSVRQQSGTLILRLEDIDSPRVKPWAVEQTIEDLRWLGLDWDQGPDIGGPNAPYVQTERRHRYSQVLDDLIHAKVVYRCYCTRSEVAAAASAPHEYAWPGVFESTTNLVPLEGLVYPGICRTDENFGHEKTPSHKPFAWRWMFTDQTVEWMDQVLGLQRANPSLQLGDFVIGKSDGTPSYQLAVAVDDHDMGVTEVVRGNDLVPSTYRQLAILEHLGWNAPSYAHLPLIIGTDGRRLAKRHGDTRLSHFRQMGIRAETIVGYLAWSVGLQAEPTPIQPNELIGRLDWRQMGRHNPNPTVFSLDAFLRHYTAGR
jgi:glutamyl-tRNA synthetase